MNKKNITESTLLGEFDVKSKKNKNKVNCTKSTNLEDFKSKIKTLYKTNKLDKLRFDENYTTIMANNWLMETPICRYGSLNGKYPANSLPAYKDTIKNKFALMLSVQILDDGTCVCFRDKTLGKQTNQNGFVANTTIDEIKKLKLEKTEYGIPTLDEALEEIQGKTPVIIEVYNEGSIGKKEEIILGIIENYIEKYKAWDKIAILSINPYTLEWFYNHAPYYTRIINSSSFSNVTEYANIKTKKLKKLKYTRKVAHADFISYNASELPCIYIDKYKPFGVLAYNVTSPEDYENSLPYSDNIIFNGFIPTI